MKMHALILPLLLATAAATAHAHTHLEGSVPADKARVKSPGSIELHFSEAAKLTSLTLQKGADAAQPLKPLPANAAAAISMPVPALAPGDYQVNWRVVGDDGHVMSGKFGFTVDPAAPAAGKMVGHDHKAASAPDPHKH